MVAAIMHVGWNLFVKIETDYWIISVVMGELAWSTV